MATIRLLFFEIYKRDLWSAKSMVPAKHVAHNNSPRSGFSYYNLTTIQLDGSAYHPLPREALSSSVGLRPVNLHQYPASLWCLQWIPVQYNPVCSKCEYFRQLKCSHNKNHDIRSCFFRFLNINLCRCTRFSFS